LAIQAQFLATHAALQFATFTTWLTSPLSIVVVLSVVIGLLMIVLFGYTSDQKAIGIAKDQLKAHLLAVRLFRDQLHVVMGSYGKVLGGTWRYLKLAFKPLIYVIIPITAMIVYLDRSLGLTGIQTNTPFLITARVSNADALTSIYIDLPQGITATAPPVHVSVNNEAVWRLEARQEGAYEVKIATGNDSVVKTVRVTTGLAQVSPERLRGHLWDRLFSSGESAIPDNSAIESIAVTYPERNIPLGVAGYEMNWIWLFFILSMIAGFIFKELLGIKV